jgi:putative YhdH/YhfP family quinone oxidoreductase
VLIEVAFSSVNYKDALAAQGHPGVARKFPHVPGIDAAGTVVESTVADYQPGDRVLVTSYELGVERWGGWSQYVRVPAAWVIPLPEGLSLADSMTLGTAGLTAGLCIHALQHHGVGPDAGDVVVSGATGGVGSLAVMLLAKIGYTVVAVSGKADRTDWLRELGAALVVGRDQVMADSPRPLLSARWSGVVDTVGGGLLASLLRSVKNEGCVAACGVVGGADLHTSVYPFILRGVTLRGIDSAWCPMTRRREVWELLAGAWKLESLAAIRETIGLDELADEVDQLLVGRHAGRTLVDVRR